MNTSPNIAWEGVFFVMVIWVQNLPAPTPAQLPPDPREWSVDVVVADIEYDDQYDSLGWYGGARSIPLYRYDILNESLFQMVVSDYQTYDRYEAENLGKKHLERLIEDYEYALTLLTDAAELMEMMSC